MEEGLVQVHFRLLEKIHICLLCIMNKKEEGRQKGKKI